LIHSLLLFAPFAFLPVAISSYGIPPQDTPAISGLLGLLLLSVAVPFFGVSPVDHWCKNGGVTGEFPHSHHPSPHGKIVSATVF
jgi:hypothetical protein